MKRWKWIALGVTFIVLVACLAVFNRAQPPSGMPFLRPHITDEKIDYQIGTVSLVGLPETTIYQQLRTIEVRGMSTEDVAKQIEAHYPKSEGWNFNEFRSGGELRMLMGGKIPTSKRGTPIPSVSTITVYSRGSDGVTINEAEPLSPLQVWFIRLRHAGEDPFNPRLHSRLHR